MRLIKQNVERIVSNPADIARLESIGFKRVSMPDADSSETNEFMPDQPKRRGRRPKSEAIAEQ